MGAGTFHPATFLRSLGPEPWRAAYPQPCRRPTDGRYGENPNRMQHYYQYQVVLKPAPDNIQELVSGKSGSLGDQSEAARHPVHPGRLGVAHAGSLGIRLGSPTGRDGNHPIHLLPGNRRDRAEPDHRRNYVRDRTHRHVPAAGQQRLRSRLDGQIAYGDIHHETEVQFSRYNFEEAMWRCS